MELHDYVIFLSLALVCEILGTISGFGSSILFVPMAALYFDLKTVLGITAVFHVFSNVFKIMLFRKGVDKEVVVKLGIPAILFVLIGSWITTIIAIREIELFLAIALVGLALFLLINQDKALPKTNGSLYLSGTLSGFLAGIAGTGGAIRGIALAAFRLPKNAFIATSAIIDLGVDVSRMIIYLSYGYVEKELFLLIPFLAGVSAVGSYIGKRLLKFMPERIFRFMVLGIIIVTALYTVVKLLFFDEAA